MPHTDAKTWTTTASTPNSSTARTEQIAAIRDPELRIACVRAVNDWARELYAELDVRFIMLLPLPCQTPAEATAEFLAGSQISACRPASSSTG